jgi:hypothetical protein
VNGSAHATLRAGDAPLAHDHDRQPLARDHTKVIGYLAAAACHVETLQAANPNWQEAYGPLIQETIKVHLKARRIGGQEG